MKASTWLITGCARGIGRGLVKEVLQRPQTTVFAGVRDTQAQAAIDLQNLKTGEGSQLVLVKLDATKHADSQSAASTIKSHGVDHLDVVVANAGIVTPLQPTVDMPESDFLNTFQANTLGPIFLFQAVEPLLSAAANPRFFVTSSILGSSGFADKIPLPTSPYGISKAGINFFLRKMHGEFPKITFVPLHPGLVDTDMGGPFSKAAGMSTITVDESVRGYLNQIDNATRDTTGGQFIDYTGESQPL